MKILIAYDGSESANAALKDLGRAGLPGDAEAVVVSVTELWLAPEPSGERTTSPYVSQVPVVESEEEARAGIARDRVRELFPDWSVTTEVLVGSPAPAIVHAAEELESDLVVVGSHGRTALGRLFLGSVSSGVASRAPCSVRVVRAREEEPQGAPRIVVAFKGAPSGDEAVAAVLERAWPPGTQVRLVTAFGPYAILGDQLQATLDRVTAMHAEAADALRAKGLEVESVVTEGDPRRTVVDIAGEWQADAIFVGTRDLTREGRFLLGSVSTAIVHHATCSVEVVRLRGWQAS